jgi:hypothetical protein
MSGLSIRGSTRYFYLAKYSQTCLQRPLLEEESKHVLLIQVKKIMECTTVVFKKDYFIAQKGE